MTSLQQHNTAFVLFAGPNRAFPLHVDHDHQTGQVRGLLCENCNLGIGKFGDDPDRIAKAIEYLNREPMHADDIESVLEWSQFAASEIPYWEEQGRDVTYRTRRNRILRKELGIRIEQYEALLANGNGVCWICHHPETQQSNKKSRYANALSVDHDHTTNMIRGLLCSSCNFGIGQFKDSPEIVASAIDYIRR